MSWIVRHARILLGVYSVLLALALFFPNSDHQASAVARLSDLLVWLGAPSRFVTFNRLEVVMNAVIVAPVTLLASLVWPRWSWRDWTTGGFLVALMVEGAQGLLLPGRQAAFSDVVANTAGALGGALLVALSRSMLRARKSR
jgi:glycopeptide antibiotics resistance protein